MVESFSYSVLDHGITDHLSNPAFKYIYNISLSELCERIVTSMQPPLDYGGVRLLNDMEEEGVRTICSRDSSKVWLIVFLYFCNYYTATLLPESVEL